MKMPQLSPGLLSVIVQAVSAMISGDAAKAARLAREAAQTAAMDEALSRRPARKR